MTSISGLSRPLSAQESTWLKEQASQNLPFLREIAEQLSHRQVQTFDRRSPVVDLLRGYVGHDLPSFVKEWLLVGSSRKKGFTILDLSICSSQIREDFAALKADPKDLVSLLFKEFTQASKKGIDGKLLVNCIHILRAISSNESSNRNETVDSSSLVDFFKLLAKAHATDFADILIEALRHFNLSWLENASQNEILKLLVDHLKTSHTPLSLLLSTCVNGISAQKNPELFECARSLLFARAKQEPKLTWNILDSLWYLSRHEEKFVTQILELVQEKPIYSSSAIDKDECSNIALSDECEEQFPELALALFKRDCEDFWRMHSHLDTYAWKNFIKTSFDANWSCLFSSAGSEGRAAQIRHIVGETLISMQSCLRSKLGAENRRQITSLTFSNQ